MKILPVGHRQSDSSSERSMSWSGDSETAKDRGARRRARTSQRVRVEGRPAPALPAGRCVAAGGRPSNRRGGIRRASSEGLELARRITEMLVSHGVTVVSGLALGIDTVGP